MARRIARDPIYSGRRFSAETIETCVRWYITYRLSHRDLVAMMAEQGIVVSHTTIMRWVLRYVPEYERRWSRFARSPGSSWRMDEAVGADRKEKLGKQFQTLDPVELLGRIREATDRKFNPPRRLSSFVELVRGTRPMVGPSLPSTGLAR